MPFRARPTQGPFPTGRIVVLGGEAEHLHPLTETIRTLGHQVTDTAPESEPKADAAKAWVDVDMVLVVAEDRDSRWLGQAKTVHRQPAAPPIVVLGPKSGSTWRHQALEAGAFLCASWDTPADELRLILAAAIRYRSLEKEINMLRIECERICMGLLTSYGEAASTLKDTSEEVEVLRQNLSEIRNQIIRAFV